MVKIATINGDVNLDKPFASLTLDTKTGGLGLDWQNLTHILHQVVSALNSQHEQIENLKAEDLDLRDAIEGVEQGVVSYDGRIRECEESCQEVMCQVKTAAAAEKQREQRMEEMRKAAMEAKAAANKAKDQAANASSAAEAANKAKDEPEENFEEFASVADLNRLKREIQEASETATRERKELRTEFNASKQETQAKIGSIEADVNRRFDEFLNDKHQRLQAEVEALRSYREKDRERAAEKRDLTALVTEVQTMRQMQNQNSERFEAAMKDVGRVSDIVQGVEGTKEQLQELWRFTRKESKELREVCAHTFEGQRREIRSKAEAIDTRDSQQQLKRELAGFTERIARLEGVQYEFVKAKAERNEVAACQEALARIAEELRERDGVLFGVRRCLSCNRTLVDQNNEANQVELQKERQKNMLLHTIEKAVTDAGNSKINFLSIEVGKSGVKKGVDGALYHTAEIIDKAAPHSRQLAPLQDLALMQLETGGLSHGPPSTGRLRFNENAPGKGRKPHALPQLKTPGLVPTVGGTSLGVASELARGRSPGSARAAKSTPGLADFTGASGAQTARAVMIGDVMKSQPSASEKLLAGQPPIAASEQAS